MSGGKRRPMQRAYMPWYTGRYIRKTRRLRARHHGAYMLILMELWESGGSIEFDLDDLREIACEDRRSWPSTWKKIERFFTIHDGMISQHTVTEELQTFTEKRRAQVEGGKRGGANSARKRKENKDAAQGKLKVGSSNQAKGLVSSLQEERPSLIQSDKDRFDALLSDPMIERMTSPSVLADLKANLDSFDPETSTFFVSERCASEQDWFRVQQIATSEGFRIELSTQRRLRLVSG